MVTEINLSTITSLANSDFVRFVTASGDSRKVTLATLLNVIGRSNGMAEGDYFYFSDSSSPSDNDWRLFLNDVFFDFERYDLDSTSWTREFRIGGSIFTDVIELVRNPLAEILVNDGTNIRNLVRSAAFSDGQVFGDIFGSSFILTSGSILKVSPVGEYTLTPEYTVSSDTKTGTDFSFEITTLPNVDGGITRGGQFFPETSIPASTKVQFKVFRTSDLVNPVYINISDAEFESGLGDDVNTNGTFSIKPLFYAPGGEDLQIDVKFSQDVTLKGDNSGASFVPQFSNDRIVVTFDEILTDANLISQLDTLSGDDVKNVENIDGTHLRVTFRNGNTKVLDLSSTTPPQNTGVVITNFSIDFPSRVDLDTDLNVTKTVSYRITDYTEVVSIVLEVTRGSDSPVTVSLTVPDSDGSHSEDITFPDLDTSSAVNVTMRIKVTDTDSNIHNSNSITLRVADLPAQELFYYGLSASSDLNGVDIATLTSVEAQTGQHAISTGTTSDNDYFLILVPTDHDITSIVDTNTQPVLAAFDKSLNVRIIGGQNYNGYSVGPLIAGGDETYFVTLA